MTDLAAVNYNEEAVPAYTLPDPLINQDGTPVQKAAHWEARREEIRHLFNDQMYGYGPLSPRLPVRYTQISEDREVYDGRGLCREMRLSFTGNNRELNADVLLYYPTSVPGPCPFFLGLNFAGNHAVVTDPLVHLAQCWIAEGYAGVVDHKATDAGRGSAARRWPVEMILRRGYGLATACYNDFDPDFDDGFQNGIHPLFYGSGQERPETNEWGAIGAWAWGLSRILDYFDEDDRVDIDKVAVMGHSRLGKTALWAGACDPRFAMVISNDSGCGGAALSRRRFGETIASMNDMFPHWCNANFKAYNHREDDLPFDQHMLMALIAPRPLYVASAAEDLWADPRGEFLGAYHAAPVYRLLGTDGLAANQMPELEEPILSRIGYHIRRGVHDVTDYDWERYLDFADLHF